MDREALIAEACVVREHAFAPLTGVKVGCVLVARDGTHIPGCNVESESGIVHTCAERNAIWAARARGLTDFVHVLVLGDFHSPIPPCGYCRQALLEFAPGITITMATTSGQYEETTIEALMPTAYHISDRADEKNPA